MFSYWIVDKEKKIINLILGNKFNELLIIFNIIRKFLK